jgi:hypothetical protein
MAITYPLSPPTSPGYRQIRIGGRSVVAVSESPFTLSQQVQEHPGQMWMAEVSLPPMQRADAQKWLSFLLSLKGRVGTFLLGDPVCKTPRGSIAGTPLVNGAHSARSSTLSIKGLTAGTTLLAGDYVQVGTASSSRLHKNLQDATASGAGVMTIDIWPNLRADLASNAAVTVTNTVGLFRLASNTVEWDVGEAQMYGLSFAAVEALSA